MLKYIMQYRYRNLLIAFLLVSMSLIGTSFAFIQMYLGKLVMDGNFNMLVKVLLLNLFLRTIWNLLKYCEKKYQARTIALMNRAFRKDISQKIMAKTFQEFERTDIGEYISWYTNDVKEAENQGFSNFYSCVNMVLELLLGALSLIFIRIELLILTLAVSAAAFFISNHFSKKVEKFSEKVSRAMARFTDEAKEQIGGLGVLRVFGVMPRFEREMGEAGQRLEEERFQFVKKRGMENYKATVINIIGLNAINILTFVLCALRIIAPEVIFGSVNLTNQVGNSFTNLLQMKIQLAGSKPYFAKVKKAEGTTVEKPQLPPLKEGIETQNLTFSYGERPVLENLSLQFKAGGKYAIVGNSGCGKSTLLKLLMGQLEGYQGTILFDGKEAGGYDPKSFYHQMAYIEQSVFLFNTTIRENITLGDSFTQEKMDKALYESALLQDLELLPEGLETVTGENGKNLSGGQKQRIAVARALIHDRPILIVDEGTSALDKENAQKIEAALLNLNELTLIVVSHHLIEKHMQFYDMVYRIG